MHEWGRSKGEKPGGGGDTGDMRVGDGDSGVLSSNTIHRYASR